MVCPRWTGTGQRGTRTAFWTSPCFRRGSFYPAAGMGSSRAGSDLLFHHTWHFFSSYQRGDQHCLVPTLYQLCKTKSHFTTNVSPLGRTVARHLGSAPPLFALRGHPVTCLLPCLEADSTLSASCRPFLSLLSADSVREKRRETRVKSLVSER